MDKDNKKKDMINSTYIRKSKRDAIKDIIAGYENQTGRLSIRRVENVSLIPRGSCPNIEPQDNLLIDDCDNVAEIAFDEISPVEFLTGKTLYGGFFRKEWGHFLLNSTSRLWPIYNSEVDIDDFERIVFFTPDNDPISIGGNFLEFLKLAGISDKVVILKDTTRFEDLYVPDLSFEFMLSYSEEFMGIFNHVRNAAVERIDEYDADSSLLLSRAHVKSCLGKQINIELVDELFSANGFEIIYPEEIPLTELICRMARASEIMTYSGSTAHNLIFAPSGTSFVIIERSAATNMPQIGVFLAMGSNDVCLIDAAYHPLITSSTDPLAIYGMTDYLKRYLNDYKMAIPLGWLSSFRPKKELREYMKFHKRFYGHSLGFNAWEAVQYEAIIEAYYESVPRYEKWLGCRAPLTIGDWFSPRIMYRYLRDFLKK